MGVEINKFLFCIPLKVGLLLYGYVNLIIWSIFSTFLIENEMDHGFSSPRIYTVANMLYDIILVTCAVEPMFSILLLVGVHMSQPNCLKVFYWYKLVVYIPTFLVYCIMGIHIYEMQYQHDVFDRGEDYYIDANGMTYILATIVALFAIGTGIATYVLVAVQSYNMKLERDASLADDLYTTNLLTPGNAPNDIFSEFTNENSKAKYIVY